MDLTDNNCFYGYSIYTIQVENLARILFWHIIIKVFFCSLKFYFANNISTHYEISKFILVENIYRASIICMLKRLRRQY